MMSSPLVKYPTTTLLMPPRFMGSVGYYVAMARYGRVIVDCGMRYNKRHKAVHRFDIVDTRGCVQLTVPVGKPQPPAEEPHPVWKHCPVSTHDEWWRQMRITLESAYGRTPFFEFIIDKFSPIFRSPEQWEQWPDILTLDARADSIIREILGFENTVEWLPTIVASEYVDMRQSDFIIENQPEYWQVRAPKLGFHPNLSILDLIFNLGPESPIYINQI